MWVFKNFYLEFLSILYKLVGWVNEIVIVYDFIF